MKNYILYLFIFLFSASCKEKKIIQGFDSDVWKSSRMGCEGNRLEKVNLILTNKKEWLGIDDDEIVDLLGRPERSYYYERNVRAFAYYLTNGKQCDSTHLGFGNRLIIEFNATGYSKRIFIERD